METRHTREREKCNKKEEQEQEQENTFSVECNIGIIDTQYCIDISFENHYISDSRTDKCIRNIGRNKSKPIVAEVTAAAAEAATATTASMDETHLLSICKASIL